MARQFAAVDKHLEPYSLIWSSDSDESQVYLESTYGELSPHAWTTTAFTPPLPRVSQVTGLLEEPREALWLQLLFPDCSGGSSNIMPCHITCLWTGCPARERDSKALSQRLGHGLQHPAWEKTVLRTLGFLCYQKIENICFSKASCQRT